MLVLTRKQGERVMIGSNMSVVVLGVQGNRVKLGINAPPDVPVLREELTAFLALPALNSDPCNANSICHS